MTQSVVPHCPLTFYYTHSCAVYHRIAISLTGVEIKSDFYHPVTTTLLKYVMAVYANAIL